MDIIKTWLNKIFQIQVYFLNVCINYLLDFLLSPVLLVYRVNWLWARAQRNRWQEELPRTQREMIWTTLYFIHQRDMWQSRLQSSRSVVRRKEGFMAYCEKKIYIWEEMARIADIQFQEADTDYCPVWKPLISS